MKDHLFGGLQTSLEVQLSPAAAASTDTLPIMQPQSQRTPSPRKPPRRARQQSPRRLPKRKPPNLPLRCSPRCMPSQTVCDATSSVSPGFRVTQCSQKLVQDRQVAPAAGSCDDCSCCTSQHSARSATALDAYQSRLALLEPGPVVLCCSAARLQEPELAHHPLTPCLHHHAKALERSNLAQSAAAAAAGEPPGPTTPWM